MAIFSSGSQGARAQANDAEIARLAFRYVVRADDLGMDMEVSTSEDSDDNEASPHEISTCCRFMMPHTTTGPRNARKNGDHWRELLPTVKMLPPYLTRLANEVVLCIDRDMTLTDTTAAPVEIMTFAVPPAVDVAVVMGEFW